ncbi:MAG: DUF4442 domain-containing protein [Pyrinomonadaceae bacterium]
MPESGKTKWLRRKFNFFPAYRGTGGRIDYIADDLREIRIRLPLSWRTRNYVGTIFGGSMYGAVDPIYMVMLIRLLGRDYVVWDKSASIRFRRPGKATLFATFVITAEETEAIKTELTERKSLERIYQIDLVDAAGKVHAKIEKSIYIGRRERA